MIVVDSRINLVSWKNIDIWPSGDKLWAKMTLRIPIIPYIGIWFMAITQQFSGQSGWIFYGNSGDWVDLFGRPLTQKFRA